MEVLLISSVVVILLVIVFCFWIYFTNKELWRKVYTSKLDFSIISFIFHIVGLYLKKVPPYIIFNSLVNAKKGGSEISIKNIKEYYFLTRQKIKKATEDLNKRHREGLLVIKEVGGYFLVSSSAKQLVETMINASQSDYEISINEINPNYKQTGGVSDEVELIVRMQQDEIVNSYDTLKKMNTIPGEEVNEDDPELQKQIAKFKKLRATELTTTFKDIGGFFAVDGKKNIMVNLILKKSINVLLRAQQSGLAVDMKDLESYFGIDGDIEKAIDVLLRARLLNMTITFVDLEKYIVVGGDIVMTIDLLINAQKAGVTVSLKQLERFFYLGGDVEKAVKALIKAKQANLDISITDLGEYFAQGGDINEAVNALTKAKQENLEISLFELGEFYALGGNVKKAVLSLIKAKQSGIAISFMQLKKYFIQGGNTEKLIQILIRAKKVGLDVTFKEFEKYHRAGGDIKDLVKALIIKRIDKLEISKEKLIDIHVEGGNALSFAKAYKVVKALNLSVSSEKLETDMFNGRDILKIMFAISHARKEGVDLSYGLAVTIDRRGEDIQAAVKWAINPKVIHIEPMSIVAKNGIQLMLNADVTVRGRVNQYLKGSRDKVLNDRVNEAIVREVESCNSHEDVMKSLPQISDKVKKRLWGEEKFNEKIHDSLEDLKESNDVEQKLNKSSAYEILDINIPLIDIGKDTYAELKKEQAIIKKIVTKTEAETRKAAASAQEKEAKAKLIEAEAELQRGMAKAFKEGKMDTKEYHKKKIFDNKIGDDHGH